MALVAVVTGVGYHVVDNAEQQISCRHGFAGCSRGAPNARDRYTRRLRLHQLEEPEGGYLFCARWLFVALVAVGTGVASNVVANAGQQVSCRHRFAGSVNWRRFNALNGKDEADGSLLWSTTGHSHGIQVWRDAPITATLSIARQPWGSRSFKRAVLWVGLSGSTKDQVVFLRVFALFELTLWYLFTQQNEKWFVQALR